MCACVRACVCVSVLVIEGVCVCEGGWMGIERHAQASTRKHAGTGSKRHLCSPPAARVCRSLGLHDNDLAALPEGIFAPLTKLRQVTPPPIVSASVCGIDTRVPIWWTYTPVSAVPQARVRTRGRSLLVTVAPTYEFVPFTCIM